MIDPDDSCAQCLYGAHGLEDVTRPDSRRESVGGIVRDLHRIFFIVKRNDGSNRSENFLARNPGAIVDVVEDSGLHEVALGKFLGPAPARSYFGFLLADI